MGSEQKGACGAPEELAIFCLFSGWAGECVHFVKIHQAVHLSPVFFCMYIMGQ